MPAFTWPMTEATNSTIALPIPVTSRMQPSRTKTGTDRRTRLDIPSSIRPIITKIGAVLANVRKASVPSPKQKAIGTPIASISATKSPRKIGRFQFPNPAKTGSSRNSAATMAATVAMEPMSARGVLSRTAWAIARIAIRSMPNGSAAAR